MTVTKGDRDAILGLADTDGAQALDRVLDSLDPAEQALATRGVQVGIAADEYAEAHLEGGYLIRPVLGVDRARGAVLVADEVQLGATIRFHIRDAEGAQRQLSRAASRLVTDTGFDTVEAVLMLGSDERSETLAADIAATAAQLSGPAVIGASVAGELVPVAGRVAGRVALQGWTTTLLAFGSGSAAARGTSR